MEDSRIRSLLGRTYAPFFSRFGGFTDIQREAIPSLLEGRNLFLISPAATGKTEAAAAPVIERLLAEGIPEPVAILYVAPTRALVNDLEKRLLEPVERTGLSFAVRTGERREIKAQKPPHFLVTTPESLDSILCRTPRILKNIKVVILDELHLIDGTYRGDQMRVLLNRLRFSTSCGDFQTVAMSATAPEPQKMGERYMADFAVAGSGSPKRLRTLYFEEIGGAVNFMKRERLLKAIVFCNSRKEAEWTSAMLKEEWHRDRVYVHHASLSRCEREEVEKAMRTWEWGICVATMTLEVGIDIGDIDAVVLMHPPPSPEAFLQRIGRGCRRKEGMVAICIYEGDAERDLFGYYEKFARAGETADYEYSPDLSVVPQQIFSTLYGAPAGVKKQDLIRLLAPLAGREILDKILGHLASLDLIQERGGIISAGARVMDMGERGLIHSNIPDSREFKVFNIENGLEVGETAFAGGEGTAFILAGRVWKVVKKSGNRLIAREISGEQSASLFGKREKRGAFHKFLPEELQRGR